MAQGRAQAEIDGGGQVVIGGVAPGYLTSERLSGVTLTFEEAFEPLSLRSQLSLLFYQQSNTTSPFCCPLSIQPWKR